MNKFNFLHAILMVIITGTVLVVFDTTYSEDVIDLKDRASSYQSYREMGDSISNLMEEYSIPGVAVAMVSNDSILLIECFGFADIESGLPVTDSTLFCVGSCTKSFLGLGFLKLIEDDRVDISKPIIDIVPEIEIDNPWENTDPVRIIHLLEHTSGFDDIHPNSLNNEQNLEMPLYEALLLRPNARIVRWQPGMRYSYSSPGYTLAGYIMEKITGETYEDFLKEKILNPIGMKTSALRITDDCRRLLAVGYGENFEPLPYIQGFDRPASSLNSSIVEMAKFVQFLLNKGRIDDKQIISISSVDLIGKPTTTLAARAGLEDGYSYGIGVRFQDGFKWYGHSGGGPGCIAKYSYLKDHQLGFIVLANCFDPQKFQNLCKVVQSHLIIAIEPESGSSMQIPNEQLQEYVGYYENQNSRMQLVRFMDVLFGGMTISFENDTLYENEYLSNKEALVAVSKNKFRKINEAGASRIFVTNSDQSMVYATRGSFYVRAGNWKPYIYPTLFIGALVIMLSAIGYAIFWVPVYAYKRIRKRNTISPYLRMRVLPLLAVLSLLISIYVVSDQDILRIGQKTTANIVFFMLTIVFAGLSTLSILVAVKSFFKSVKTIAKLYCLLLSTSCFGMTFFLSYWGIIGLRIWVY